MEKQNAITKLATEITVQTTGFRVKESESGNVSISVAPMKSKSGTSLTELFGKEKAREKRAELQRVLGKKGLAVVAEAIAQGYIGQRITFKKDQQGNIKSLGVKLVRTEDPRQILMERLMKLSLSPEQRKLAAELFGVDLGPPPE